MASPRQEAQQLLALIIKNQHCPSGQEGRVPREEAGLELAVCKPQGSFSKSEMVDLS